MTVELSVRDHFLSLDEVRLLTACCRERQDRGEFQAARVGKGTSLRQAYGVRGDLTCWLQAPLYAAEMRLLEKLEWLRTDFNEKFFLGLFELELHYAWYPPGGGYTRHLDQPRGSEQRVLSLIMYLNEAWAAGDGGQLRVYAVDDTYCDIEPLAGRLVCFASAGVEHAVMPAARDRFSISGWLRRRD